MGLCAVRSIGLFPDASLVIHLEFRVSGTSGYTWEYHEEYDIPRDEIIYQTTVLVLATRESSIIRVHTQTTHTYTHTHTHTHISVHAAQIHTVLHVHTEMLNQIKMHKQEHTVRELELENIEVFLL